MADGLVALFLFGTAVATEQLVPGFGLLGMALRAHLVGHTCHR